MQRLWIKPGREDRPAFLEHLLGLLPRLGLRARLLLDRGFLLQLGQLLLHRLQVGKHQLGGDGLDVVRRIHVTIDVGDVVVVETPRHLADGVGLTNVGEELVAHPLALAGALDDSSNVDEGHRRRNGLGGVEHLRQHVQTLVRNPDHADIRLNGRKRIVRRQDVILGQRVEQGRLAGVGKTDDSNRKCHVEPW